MLKRSGHAVQTSVLAGQRAAARAGVPEGGLRGTFTFITQLGDMISKIQARLTMRLNELYTPHAAQTTGGARRVRGSGALKSWLVSRARPCTVSRSGMR